MGNELVLSEAQAAYAAQSYEEFVREYNETARRILPVFFEASAAAARASMDGGITLEYADNLTLADRMRTQFTDALRLLEHSFFDSVIPVLTPEQASRLERIRLDRRKAHCRAAADTLSLESIMVEIRPIVEEFDFEVDAPDSAERIVAMLDAHDHSMVAAFCELAQALKQQTEMWYLLAERSAIGRAGDGTDDPRISDINRRVDRFRQRVTRAALNLRDRNEARIVEIKSLLPERLAESLERRYRFAAYPSIYTVEDDLYEIYTRAFDEPGLTPEERDQIGVLRLQYLAAYASVSRSMVDALVQWRLGSYEIVASDYADHQASLKRLAERRRALADDHLTLLREVLGDRFDEVTGSTAREEEAQGLESQGFDGR